jgi:hypothetical protein
LSPERLIVVDKIGLGRMGIVTIVHERVGMVSGSSVDKCPRRASSTSRDLSRLLCHSYLIQSADSRLTSPTHEPYSFTHPPYSNPFAAENSPIFFFPTTHPSSAFLICHPRRSVFPYFVARPRLCESRPRLKANSITLFLPSPSNPQTHIIP